MSGTAPAPQKTCKLQRQMRRDRPNISEGSLKTYMSSLRVLKKRITGETDIDCAKFLLNFKAVMKAVDMDSKINTKKNRLTAIIVAVGASPGNNTKLVDKYNTVLKSLNDEYFAYLKTQKKTPTQEKNWISYAEVIRIANELTKEVQALNLAQYPRGHKLTNKEFDTLQQYAMLRVYLTFPIRNDFADMKVLSKKRWSQLEKATRGHSNYLILLPDNKKEFHINQFKNRRFIGAKILTVPPKLNRVLNLWLKFNKSGYLFVKLREKSKPLTPNALTRYMNRIFIPRTAGKRISTSMLRHIIISHMLKGKKTILEKEADEKKIENTFFHSEKVNDLYRKID